MASNGFITRPGVYSVVYEYAQKEEGIAAGELALKLLDSLLPVELRTQVQESEEGVEPGDWSWDAARDDFIRYAQKRALGPSTASLVRAAEERNIPWLRLNQQSLIQLGHGKFQQRIQATVTGRTPYIAVELAGDKDETNRILHSLGLPVPRQMLVTQQSHAVQAAAKLGGPVVLKPYNGNHGRGITINITGADEVRAAYQAAAEHSKSVIVETGHTPLSSFPRILRQVPQA